MLYNQHHIEFLATHFIATWPSWSDSAVLSKSGSGGNSDLQLIFPDLQALWLEDGGSLFDSSICEGLSRLTSLRRLCLFNFVVGPKLGHALKKLPHLDRLFVLPVGTEEVGAHLTWWL